MTNTPEDTIDERSHLLPNENRRRPSRKTPLPKTQIAIILLLQLCEPIASQSIFPYINQLISELDITGGDERKVGYYAGLIESLFFATEALTVLQWSRASDHIGRKPVLLIGLFGIMLSMLCFGLSRTFLMLVISRCFTGLLNGNIGVMKSVMGELTDLTNRAEGFSLMPVVWGLGATIGPLLGGTLARPHENFPKYFSGAFWRQYPYFLPCLVPACFIMVAFLITLFVFKETNPRRKPEVIQTIEASNVTKAQPHDEPVPVRELLRTRSIIISVSNYVVLAFLNISFCALFPLFLAMPLEIGGLGLAPRTIGIIIGSYGAGGAIFQALCFARVVRYFGERGVYIAAICTYLPIFVLLPTANILAGHLGRQSSIPWILIALVAMMMAINDIAFGTIFMYITSSAPNRRSLGATNGLSQTTVSIARAVGPALATSFFSLSVEKNLLAGYAVYVFYATLACFAVVLATRLPEKVWDADDQMSPSH